ncbi:hypothetical protein [Paractinoplanes maris]|nr:hypothetical protein [Actinoplanes maris]
MTAATSTPAAAAPTIKYLRLLHDDHRHTAQRAEQDPGLSSRPDGS